MQAITYNAGNKGVDAHLIPLTANMLEHVMADALINTNLEIRQTTKIIYATNGMEILIDEEDYPLLSRHSWYINFSKGKPYAITKLKTDSTIIWRAIFMPHLILGTSTFVDHINGNTLNNQKYNLRKATKQQNGWNNHKMCRVTGGKTATSQYKGVRRLESKTKGTRWLASLKHVELGQHKSTGKMIYIGYFNTEIEAAIAYNNKVTELRGEWAYLNPIPEAYDIEDREGK